MNCPECRFVPSGFVLAKPWGSAILEGPRVFVCINCGHLRIDPQTYQEWAEHTVRQKEYTVDYPNPKR